MAFNKFFGWRPSLPDPRDFRYLVPSEHRKALPPACNLFAPPASPRFDPVFDQGALGSCGPNALALDVLFRLVQEGRPAVSPSRLFLYYTTRELMGTVGYDSGVDNRTMLKALQKFAWCDEADWPYVVSEYRRRPAPECYRKANERVARIRYEAVAQELVALKSAIVSGTPVVFGFTVFDSIDSPIVDRTGVIPMPGRRDRVIGGHDVLLFGYDDSIGVFRLRNSWGDWGAAGDGTIPYEYALRSDLAADFWRVLDAAGPLPPPAPLPPPPPPPWPPPSPVGFLIDILADLPKGHYVLQPATIAAELSRRGLDFGKVMRIVLLVIDFIRHSDRSVEALLKLIAAIEAIFNEIPF